MCIDTHIHAMAILYTKYETEIHQVGGGYTHKIATDLHNSHVYILVLFRKIVCSGVGSEVAPGARAPPFWIVLESFHKRETCFAGRLFRAWSGGPSLAVAEPPRGIERAWLREALVERALIIIIIIMAQLGIQQKK